MAVTLPRATPGSDSYAGPMTGTLIGRHAEQAAIASFLDDIPAGSRALVVEGNAGIGKTAIWLWAINVARTRGFVVLGCRPTQAEETLPFVALGDLFEPVLDRLLSTLLPSHRTSLEAALALTEPTSGIARVAVARASLALMRNLAAEVPVVLAVDDAQWLDPGSGAVVEFIARRVADLPIGLLVARRTSRDSTGAPTFLDSLDRHRLTTIKVGPLSAGEINQLLHSSLDLTWPRPKLLELARISGGNPLHAVEIARAAVRRPGYPAAIELSVPEDPGTLLGARLESLDAKARETVLLAAAASHPTVTLVEHALGQSEGLTRAIREKIVELDDQRIRFVHPLLASVAQDLATASERQRVHELLVAAITDPEERARHRALSSTGPNEETAAELDEASLLAARRGAPEAAAWLAEQAAGITVPGAENDRQRRLTAAADLHMAAGDPCRAKELLEGLIEGMDAGPVRAGLLRRLAEATGDDLGLSIVLCEQALDEANGDPVIEARIHTALGVFTWLAGDLERAAGHCRSSAECAELSGDRALVAISLGELCHVDTVLGRPYERGDMDRALELEKEIDAFPTQLRPSFQLGVILMYTDELDRARPLLEAELERARLTGDESARFGSLFRLAEVELRAGNWGLASKLADEAVASGRQGGIEQEQAVLLTMQALVRAYLGDITGARDAAAQASTIAEAAGDRVVVIRVQGVNGFLALSQGDPAAALEVLEPAGAELRRLGVGELSVSGVVHNEAEALVAVGRLDDAERVLAYVEEKGRPTDRAWHGVVAHRGRALVAAARGDADRARAHIGHALAAAERLPQPFERARTLLVQGQVERRFKQRGVARQVLTDALDQFDSLGAALWAEKAAEELARIPGRSPGSGELTETERLVAERVADGLSNKEVASDLFISVRTVEANLSKVYAKLGIRSRTELASLLGRRSLHG